MLSWMREYAAIIMAVGILGFIGIPAFFGYMETRGGEKIGKIGSEKITHPEFDKAYRNSKLGEDPEDNKNKAQKVWESIVNEKIVNKVIKDMKLVATDQEIFNYILSNPHPAMKYYFAHKMDPNLVDTALYRSAVSDVAYLNNEQNAEVKAYIQDQEVWIRQNNIIQKSKLNDLLYAGKIPSKNEIEYLYKLQNEKVTFEYLLVNSDSIALDSNAVTNELKEKYYNENNSKFDGGERAAVEYIKVALDPNSEDENVIMTDLKKTKAAILQVEKGEERHRIFSEEARYESDDEEVVKNNGHIKSLPIAQAVYMPYGRRLLPLASGDVTEPFKLNDKFFIIYMIEKTDSTVTFGEIVKNNTISPARNVKIREKVTEIVEVAKHTSLAELAKKHGYVYDTSLYFEKGYYPADMPFFMDLGKVAFDEEKRVVDFSTKNNEHYIVKSLKVVEKGVLPLIDVEEVVEKGVRAELKIAKANEIIKEALEKVTDSLSLEMIAKEDTKLMYAKPELVTRAGFFNRGQFIKLASVAFAGKENVFSEPIEVGPTVSVVKPLKKELVTDIPDSIFSDKMYQKQTKYGAMQTGIYFNDWYEATKEQVGVEENLTKHYF